MQKKQGEIKPNIAARIQSKNEVQGYGLFITGFVSDVSIDDIFVRIWLCIEPSSRQETDKHPNNIEGQRWDN